METYRDDYEKLSKRSYPVGCPICPIEQEQMRRYKHLILQRYHTCPRKKAFLQFSLQNITHHREHRYGFHISGLYKHYN